MWHLHINENCDSLKYVSFLELFQPSISFERIMGIWFLLLQFSALPSPSFKIPVAFVNKKNLLEGHLVISCNRNGNEWKINIILPMPLSLLVRYVLSYSVNKQNLGVVKTLEILSRKSNIKRKHTLFPAYPL